MFELIREKQIPVLIDADGLSIVTKKLDLVKGYPHAILTPNRHEYQRLAAALDIDTEQVAPSGQSLHGTPLGLPLSSGCCWLASRQQRECQRLDVSCHCMLSSCVPGKRVKRRC